MNLPPQIREGTTLLEFYRQLQSLAPRYVECVCTVAGGTSHTFAHGLGRVPVGNVVVSNSDPGAAMAQCGPVHPTQFDVQLSVAADVTLVVMVW